MADINNVVNLMDRFSIDEGVQPLMDLITQIMSLPEENLSDDTIDVIGGMITGAFTPKVREDAIENVKKGFEEEGYTRAIAKETIEAIKDEIARAIDDLHPSEYKNQLLAIIFKSFFEIFDEAVERFHSYDITLPVKVSDGGQIPTYAHESDACADIYASQDMTIPAHSLSNKVPTGLRIALPEGWVAKIAPRSSIGAKTGLRLSNSIGIIDADYRGEIGILYDNISDSDYEIKAGDRIAQIWVERVERFKPVTVDILPATERGEGGFGSSGK